MYARVGVGVRERKGGGVSEFGKRVCVCVCLCVCACVYVCVWEGGA